MKLTTTNRQQVEEVPYGMFVWQTPDGEVLGDSDGNIMNVFVLDRRDIKTVAAAVKALHEAACYYGSPEGKAIWWSGKRPIDDEELANQKAREMFGLIADPLDIGAVRDAMRSRPEDE